jgi:hypothetical protein
LDIGKLANQAAIDRAKKIAGAEDDSAALAIICEDDAEGRTTLTPDWLVEIFADYLSSLDADERTKFRAAVNARVTRRRRALQVCSWGSKSSSRLDSAQGRPICRTRALGGPLPVAEISPGGRPARPARAVIPAHRRKAHGAQTNCNVGVQRLARCLARLVRLNELEQNC